MREGGMHNVAEQGCFIHSESASGATPHLGLFSWAFLWLCACLLMEVNWCELMDASLLQANSSSVAANLHFNEHNKLKNTQMHSLRWKEEKQEFPVILMTRIQDEWQACLHRALLHCQWRTTIKDPPPTQKSLKVTEWILIRSGVVNGSQHGLQWD